MTLNSAFPRYVRVLSILQGVLAILATLLLAVTARVEHHLYRVSAAAMCIALGIGLLNGVLTMRVRLPERQIESLVSIDAVFAAAAAVGTAFIVRPWGWVVLAICVVLVLLAMLFLWIGEQHPRHEVAWYIATFVLLFTVYAVALAFVPPYVQLALGQSGWAVYTGGLALSFIYGAMAVARLWRDFLTK